MRASASRQLSSRNHEQAGIAVPSLRRNTSTLLANRGLVALGGAAVVVYPLAFYGSMHLAGVAIGTVISLASAPLASGVLELVLDRRRLGPWWMTAAVLGTGGSTLLCLAKAAQPEASAAHTAAGIALGLVAGLSYALYSWVVHRLLGHGAPRAAAMGSVFGLGGLALMPVLLLTGAPLLESTTNFAVGAYMALVPMFLGYVLFGVGLTRVRPSTATTITLSEPAVAALLAVAVVGERLSGTGWVGLGVVGLALVVLAMAPGTPEVPASPTPRVGSSRGGDHDVVDPQVLPAAPRHLDPDHGNGEQKPEQAEHDRKLQATSKVHAADVHESVGGAGGVVDLRQDGGQTVGNGETHGGQGSRPRDLAGNHTKEHVSQGPARHQHVQ